MTEREIRDRAPSGATHYKEFQGGYIEYYIWCEGKLCYIKNGFELCSTRLSSMDLKPL